MAMLSLACGVCGLLAAVAVSAPSRGRLETSVDAEDVVGEAAKKVVSASLYAAGRRPTAPNGMTFGVSEKMPSLYRWGRQNPRPLSATTK